MVFNSYTFILFFGMVLLLHYLPFSWKTKKINLLLASYLFYAAWNPPFVILLWLSTLVDYSMALLLGKQENPGKRKALLWVSLAVNLGMLGFFKYGSFLLDNFTGLMSVLGINYHPAKMDIILPVGISFYTFQTLSYTLDVYRRHIRPEKSLLDFSLFVTFFPQLVAGPIVRPQELMPQFKTPHQADRQKFTWGLFLLTLGLFLKVGVADGLLADTADTVFGVPFPLHPLDAWAGVFAFSAQIFCDFAGYSTAAIGVALTLGFTMSDNFRYPYAAIGFSDFWRRWHISLSTWLRDYLYIPLGGNRKGPVHTYVNLMITMLLGGLWHGANWTFVVWGALHGLYLCIEKIIQERLFKNNPQLTKPALANQVIQKASVIPDIPISRNIARFGLALITFMVVSITWVFFRAADFGTAMRILLAMFGVIPVQIPVLTTVAILKVAVVTVALLGSHWFMRDSALSKLAGKLPWWAISLVWAGMLILLLLTQKSSGSFIYFQF
ncbi:MBOAT family O-acyltransferase [Rhodocytophaga aerolata]|uniref:MBOAT family O-acyltransferase n=1 Tax=Rhodocytophaga aerolata TaxID=455078 RepID=A0ABT8RF89_9BACT|nr:MBOAT family O-acyltransferase [Rhodocytophaga aerolata]MDO1449440.1 MBOAT family O-acyltransferase [Rhodocytophaga aerolata]